MLLGLPDYTPLPRVGVNRSLLSPLIKYSQTMISHGWLQIESSSLGFVQFRPKNKESQPQTVEVVPLFS